MHAKGKRRKGKLGEKVRRIFVSSQRNNVTVIYIEEKRIKQPAGRLFPAQSNITHIRQMRETLSKYCMDRIMSLSLQRENMSHITHQNSHHWHQSH